MPRFKLGISQIWKSTNHSATTMIMPCVDRSHVYQTDLISWNLIWSWKTLSARAGPCLPLCTVFRTKVAFPLLILYAFSYKHSLITGAWFVNGTQGLLMQARLWKKQYVQIEATKENEFAIWRCSKCLQCKKPACRQAVEIQYPEIYTRTNTKEFCYILVCLARSDLRPCGSYCCNSYGILAWLVSWLSSNKKRSQRK
jgi:hypothetical protein